LDLMSVLAADPKPEVRQDVADLLPLIGNGTFTRLAAKLSGDPNHFVRRAAARALEGRSSALQAGGAHGGIERYLRQDFARIEARWGVGASHAARRVTFRFADMLLRMAVHNVRNVLAAMGQRTQSLYQDLQSADAGRDLLEHVGWLSGRVHYLGKLVDSMRTYARVPVINRRRERLVDVVHLAARDAVAPVDGQSNGEIAGRLVIDVPEELFVSLDRYCIGMALTNVLKNAMEAVGDGDGGVIRVSARAEGPAALIDIQDTGGGIAPEDLEELRSFVPGRTTKKDSGGTGWGLAIAHRYVEAHGGELLLDSTVGWGTTITIKLPIGDGPNWAGEEQ